MRNIFSINAMANKIRPYWIALNFLTCIPVPWLKINKEQDLGVSVLIYPWVGLAFGLLLILIEFILVKYSINLAAAVMLLAWVLFTGEKHLTSLAIPSAKIMGSHCKWIDCRPQFKQRILRFLLPLIFGASLVVKFIALKVIIVKHAVPLLIFVPLISRAGVILLFMLTPYARTDEIGKVIAANMPNMGAKEVLVLIIILVLLLSGFRGLRLLAIAVAVIYLLRWLMRRYCGGVTGYGVGALIEVLEVLLVVNLMF